MRIKSNGIEIDYLREDIFQSDCYKIIRFQNGCKLNVTADHLLYRNL